MQQAFERTKTHARKIKQCERAPFMLGLYLAPLALCSVMMVCIPIAHLEQRINSLKLCPAGTSQVKLYGGHTPHKAKFNDA